MVYVGTRDVLLDRVDEAMLRVVLYSMVREACFDDDFAWSH